MAAPNLNTTISIVGGLSTLNLTASYVTVVSNAAASGKAVKIESIRVSNVGVIANPTAFVRIVRSVTQAGTFYICNSTPVPFSNALDAITRETCIYLLEGDLIEAKCSVVSQLDILCSYEILG